MATKKDLVEAYSFSRRRLVTAFVSGAPGGREVEPARPGRSLIGGVALTVLLLAGGAIGGFFSDQPGADWKDPGLVRSEADGQNYVIFDYPEDGEPELRPVINYASAQLIFGSAVDEVDEVSEEDLKEVKRGALIGILGAPSPVPSAEDLIQRGWTACTDDGAGIRVNLARTPAVDPAPNGGLVVSAGGSTYLIAQAQEQFEDNTLGPRRAYSYRLDKDRDRILTGLGIPTSDPVEVPATWLRLFPTGGRLDASSIPLPQAGKEYAGDGAQDLPAGSRVGDYYEVGGLTLVLTATGAAELSEFAAIVYTGTAQGPASRQPRPLAVDGAPGVPSVDPPYRSARWPEGTLEDVTGSYCAVLEPGDEAPVVLLASNPTDEAALPEELAPTLSDPVVEPGFGALVRSGGFDNPNQGEPHLIDDRGFDYELVGPDVAANLGFADVDAPVIPDSWLDLFDRGVSLSVDAALCPPARDPRAPTCDQ